MAERIDIEKFVFSADEKIEIAIRRIYAEKFVKMVGEKKPTQTWAEFASNGGLTVRIETTTPFRRRVLDIEVPAHRWNYAS